MDALHAFVTLLSLDRECCDWSCLEPLQTDRLASFLTETVTTVLNTGQRLIDFGDELAGPVTGPKFERAIRLDARPVGDVGLMDAAFGQAGESSISLSKQIGSPPQKFLPKIFDVQRIHELVGIRRTVILGQSNHHGVAILQQPLRAHPGSENCAAYSDAVGPRQEHMAVRRLGVVPPPSLAWSFEISLITRQLDMNPEPDRIKNTAQPFVRRRSRANGEVSEAPESGSRHAVAQQRVLQTRKFVQHLLALTSRLPVPRGVRFGLLHRQHAAQGDQAGVPH